MTTRLEQLSTLGQSPWLDYIRRDLIQDGGLQKWVEQGVRGVTSNPTLFENAIAKSDLYKTTIQELAKQGRSSVEIYEALAFADIRGAADILLSVFKESNGDDGFVSLEVPPELCDNHEETIAEGKRLWQVIDHPNLMIKVPATTEGLKAITALIAAGINVNVTLMFTMQDYLDVADAYMTGLEERLANHGDLSTVHSVASVFVSRVDTWVDSHATPSVKDLLSGKAAIANTRLIYRAFAKLFSGDRFNRLKEHGATVQRPLWASTGVKNKALSDVLYVDYLIGPDTVNTMPPQTMEAFLDHGAVVRTADRFYDEDERIVALCDQNGIDLHEVGLELKQQGLTSFATSFDSLMKVIEQERQASL